MSALLVRDLALEHWISMDRYADSLAPRLPGSRVADGWRMSGPRFFTRYWSYPRALQGQRADVVHVLDHSYAHCLRSFRGVPSVVTVHDLFPLRVLAESQRTFRGAIRDTLLRWVLHWVERADRLIVSTQYTSREVQHFLRVPEERIRVIPYGVDAQFFQRPPDEAVARRRREWLARTGNPDETCILLHVGSCQPRKNVEAAIHALGMLRGEKPVMLVQLGGTFGPTHLAAIQAAGVDGQVLQERAVTEADLVTAYYAADALLLPSTFEGYGLPLVEAMAAGLPVVTSGAGGTREAVADAGVVTGAIGPGPLADVIRDLLSNPARRSELSAKGRARAATLTWDRTAELTAAVYAELAPR